MRSASLKHGLVRCASTTSNATTAAIRAASGTTCHCNISAAQAIAVSSVVDNMHVGVLRSFFFVGGRGVLQSSPGVTRSNFLKVSRTACSSIFDAEYCIDSLVQGRL